MWGQVTRPLRHYVHKCDRNQYESLPGTVHLYEIITNNRWYMTCMFSARTKGLQRCWKDVRVFVFVKVVCIRHQWCVSHRDIPPGWRHQPDAEEGHVSKEFHFSIPSVLRRLSPFSLWLISNTTTVTFSEHLRYVRIVMSEGKPIDVVLRKLNCIFRPRLCFLSVIRGRTDWVILRKSVFILRQLYTSSHFPGT